VSANRLIIDATLSTRETLRFTPAGVPALDFTVAHTSVQPEAGGERKVSCLLFAVVLGPLAQQLSEIAIGRALRCTGFLARRYRTGTSLALHLTHFELIEGN